MRAYAQDIATSTRPFERAIAWPELWKQDREERGLGSLIYAQDPASVSGGAAARGQTSATEETSQSSGVTSWRIPPIRYGGMLTTDLRYLDVSGQRSWQLVESSDIRFGSYIWQPWFALVTGSVNVLSTQQNELTHVAGPNADRVKSESIGGSGALSVFPSSRFPFNGYFEMSDSRTTGEPTLNNYTTTRYGARQSYQPIDGRTTYSANYDRSIVDSQAFGRDVVNAYSASFSRQFDLQNLSVIGQRTTNNRERGDGSTLNRLTATHSYRPDGTISVETLANASSDEFRLTNGPAPFVSDSRFVQLNTFATWRPDPEDLPIYVTGGARYFQSTIETNGLPSEGRAVSANAAVNFRFRPDLNFFASGNVSDTSDDFLTTQTLGATYTPTPLALGKYTYAWNANLALNNQTSSTAGMQQSLAGQLGHTLSRTFSVSDTTFVSVSGGQSFSSTADTVGSATYTVSHTANAALRSTPTPNSNAYVSVLAADSRSTGTHESTFQLVNTQLTGQLQFNRYSLAAANLTFQGSRQATDTNPNTGFTFNVSGNVTYQHSKVFGVPQLRYYAAYNAYDTHYRSRLQGDFEAPREQVSQSLEQRFDYTIGRVEIRLSARYAKIEGQTTGVVFLRMVRRFGAF